MLDKQAFGTFLKSKRKERKILVRDMAEGIGVSFGYYCDIESVRRTPVDLHFISTAIKLLNLSDEDGQTLYDLAGKGRTMAPPDLTAYINENKIVRDVLRIAKDNATDEDWQILFNNLSNKKKAP